MEYSYGPYSKHNDTEQWIRITEGCPNNCPYCYEPTEIKIFDIPEIVRNKVMIIDMNLLCKKESNKIIETLGEIRVNDKVVQYELVCGIDHRVLTQDQADLLKKNRFKKIRIAWDFYYKDQYNIKYAIDKLRKAGFGRREITIFMICNWKISFYECFHKLDLCKVWQTKVADCYFDNQLSPNIMPTYWTGSEIKTFRKRVRKHNQLVNFLIDPEVKEEKRGKDLWNT